MSAADWPDARNDQEGLHKASKKNAPTKRRILVRVPSWILEHQGYDGGKVWVTESEFEREKPEPKKFGPKNAVPKREFGQPPVLPAPISIADISGPKNDTDDQKRPKKHITYEYGHWKEIEEIDGVWKKVRRRMSIPSSKKAAPSPLQIGV